MNIPTRLVAGSAAAAAFRVLDARTGDEIVQVLDADTETRRIVRRVVENGQLVRDGDRFATIEEERAIRFEPIEPAEQSDQSELEAPGASDSTGEQPGGDEPA